LAARRSRLSSSTTGALWIRCTIEAARAHNAPSLIEWW
jgi:hypothetical protein